MKYIKWVLLIIIGGVLLTTPLQSINCICLKNLWHNLKFISNALYILIPLFFIGIFLFSLSTQKLVLRVEKMNIGGFTVLFDNPIKIYKRQVRNYLDSKRTVFKIDLDNDNFKETLDSYYDVYKFFVEEIKILGDIPDKSAEKNDRVRLYNMANQILKKLNRFLMEHQSNYRRWDTYFEKKYEDKCCFMPIGELQKKYPNYENLCKGFKEVNKFFINEVAKEFEIDIKKWDFTLE
jgi:hypothetical protein